jgi:hypothetical protein
MKAPTVTQSYVKSSYPSSNPSIVSTTIGINPTPSPSVLPISHGPLRHRSNVNITAAIVAPIISIIVVVILAYWVYKTYYVRDPMIARDIEVVPCVAEPVSVDDGEINNTDDESQEVKCLKIAAAVISRSPYPELQFTRMINDHPTGQAFLMEGIYNGHDVAVKFFLDNSKRKELEILSFLSSNPPCEHLVRMLCHFDQPASITFPLLNPIHWASKTTAPDIVRTYATQVCYFKNLFLYIQGNTFTHAFHV